MARASRFLRVRRSDGRVAFLLSYGNAAPTAIDRWCRRGNQPEPYAVISDVPFSLARMLAVVPVPRCSDNCHCTGETLWLGWPDCQAADLAWPGDAVLMLTRHGSPVAEAVNDTSPPTLHRLRKSPRQLWRTALVLPICLAVAASTLAGWWPSRPNGFRDIGDPFDVGACDASGNPDDQNAFSVAGVQAEQDKQPLLAADRDRFARFEQQLDQRRARSSHHRPLILVGSPSQAHDGLCARASSSIVGPTPPHEPKPTSPQHQAGDRHEQDLCRRDTGVPLPTE